MKILLTTHVFLPDHSAGTEILTLNTALELIRLGHEVEICTGYIADAGLNDHQRFDRYEYAGIPVNRFFHSVEPMGKQSNVVEAEYNNLFFAEWFRNYLSDFSPDIVHFFHLGLLSASAIDVCHELGIPMVMTPTDFWLICPNNQLRLPDNSLCSGPDINSVNCIKHAVSNNQPPLISWAFNQLPGWIISLIISALHKGFLSHTWFSPWVRALHQRANFLKSRMNLLDKVIVPTHLMMNLLVRNGLDPSKVVFSRFGIASISSSNKTLTQHASEKLRVGFIGGLSEHKGAHLLIGAIRLLADETPVEVNIYGKSTNNLIYFEQLKQLAGTDARIHFRGTFPNSAIGDVFSMLDVLVVPSIWYENTPLVIYSAQAAGCPVIASNLGGMSEIIEHEQNGLLFAAGDVNDLARSIARLVEDRQLLQHLAGNAKAPKQINEYAAELIDVYHKILKEKREAG